MRGRRGRKGGEKGGRRGLGGGDEGRGIWGRKGSREIGGGRRWWRLGWHWEVEVETGRWRGLGRDSTLVRVGFRRGDQRSGEEKREVAANGNGGNGD